MRTALAAFLAAAIVIALGLGTILWIDRVLLLHAPWLAFLGLAIVTGGAAAWAIVYKGLARLLGAPDN